MENKICTSIEQSKKLIELGIDTSTADIFWDTLFAKKPEAQVNNHYFIDEYDDEHRVPAWSLSALLELMPIYIRINNEDYNFDLARGGAGAYTFSYIHSLKEPWELGYYLHLTTHKDSVIDAAFEMVCWLKENGKI